MFPEYRDLISKLKNSDHHFHKLFEAHNALDHEIKRLESLDTNGYEDKIHQLKLEKLHLKEQLYTILKQKSAK